MSPENDMDGVKQTLDRLKTKAGRGRENTAFSFAKLAYKVFDDINDLRDAGLSLITICKELETDGHLPAGANPYSLSKALRREGERRERRAGTAQKKQVDHDAIRKEAAAKIIASNKKTDQRKIEPDKKTDEEERRIKELTGTLVDTGTGVIRKYPDGSFEF
jgi:hypothetical protein